MIAYDILTGHPVCEGHDLLKYRDSFSFVVTFLHPYAKYYFTMFIYNWKTQFDDFVNSVLSSDLWHRVFINYEDFSTVQAMVSFVSDAYNLADNLLTIYLFLYLILITVSWFSRAAPGDAVLASMTTRHSIYDSIHVSGRWRVLLSMMAPC